MRDRLAGGRSRGKLRARQQGGEQGPQFRRPGRLVDEFGPHCRDFGRDRGNAPVKYRIALRTEGQRTTVSVLDEKGAPEKSANAERIVKVIADDLK